MDDIVRQTCIQFGETVVRRKKCYECPKVLRKEQEILVAKNSIYACVVKNYDFLKVKILCIKCVARMGD